MTSPKPITLQEQIEACEAARAFLSIDSLGKRDNDLTSALKAAAATLRELQKQWRGQCHGSHEVRPLTRARNHDR